ncbi:hypothetical protein [Comamonas thiooxydans]|uniref:hypothetical protein n=1 Tax=Comamonas thiooxydans TaxID=363952 RepID=UPI000B4176CB|nr:hypothetical protein [Comamonas thiooxydans]
MPFVIRNAKGEYLNYTVTTTHTGTHITKNWVSGLLNATKNPDFTHRDRSIIMEPGVERIEVSVHQSLVPMDTPAINELLQLTTERMDGQGIMGVGGIAAVHAMAYHWHDHLMQGHDVGIALQDIDSLVESLQDLKQTIKERVRQHDGQAMMPAVMTKLTSDDGVAKAEFNAALWFYQASVEDLVELQQCGWNCDYPADAIAHFFEVKLNEVGNVFGHINRVNQDSFDDRMTGFQVVVDAQAAKAWLAVHRPAVAAKLWCLDTGIHIEECAEGPQSSWKWRSDKVNSPIGFASQELAELSAWQNRVVE